MQDTPQREPIRIAEASQRLGKPAPTLRVLASRHHARKLLKRGREAWYDWHDLKTIVRQLNLGEPVPRTPEERDLIRERVRAGTVSAA